MLTNFLICMKILLAEKNFVNLKSIPHTYNPRIALRDTERKEPFLSAAGVKDMEWVAAGDCKSSCQVT